MKCLKKVPIEDEDSSKSTKYNLQDELDTALRYCDDLDYLKSRSEYYDAAYNRISKEYDERFGKATRSFNRRCRADNALTKIVENSSRAKKLEEVSSCVKAFALIMFLSAIFSLCINAEKFLIFDCIGVGACILYSAIDLLKCHVHYKKWYHKKVGIREVFGRKSLKEDKEQDIMLENMQDALRIKVFCDALHREDELVAKFNDLLTKYNQLVSTSNIRLNVMKFLLDKEGLTLNDIPKSCLVDEEG